MAEGAVQAFGPATPQQIYVWFLMKSSTTLYQIFRKQLLHQDLFIHTKIKKDNNMKQKEWFTEKKERKKKSSSVQPNRLFLFWLAGDFFIIWLFSFFLLSFCLQQIIFCNVKDKKAFTKQILCDSCFLKIWGNVVEDFISNPTYVCWGAVEACNTG